MTNRNPLQHDIPPQLIRGRRARISAVDPDNPHNVWVAFRGERGSPEPAYYPSNSTPVVGKDVRVTAEPELRRWKVEDYSSGEGTTISLFKVWQLNATSDSHNHIAIHPTQPWVATIRLPNIGALVLEVWDWQSETLIDSETLTSGLEIYDLKWCPNGDHLSFVMEQSPYIHVYPVDPDTGVISAAVSNPAVLAPHPGDAHVWHPLHTHIYMNRYGAVGGVPDAHYVSGWPFTTGFGTKLTAPADGAKWGAGVPPHPITVWPSPVVYDRDPNGDHIDRVRGLGIDPDGTALVMWAGDGDYGWLLMLQLGFNGVFRERYDSDLPLVYSESSTGRNPAFPVFDSTGTVIAWNPLNTLGHGGSSPYGSPAYATEYTQFGFGHINGMPVGAAGNLGGMNIPPIRAVAWRPGRDQLMVPVNGLQDQDTGEPRLSLFDMNGSRFGRRTDWYPTDSAFNWDWFSSILNWDNGYLRGGWTPDGAHYLVGLGGTTVGGLTDAIAVFKVS